MCAGARRADGQRISWQRTSEIHSPKGKPGMNSEDRTPNYRRSRACGALILILATLGLALPGALRAAETPAVEAPEVIESNAEKVAKFQIVSREFSADLKQARYVLKSDLGIFRCRLNLTNTAITNLTLVVKDEKYCEGLDFQPNRGQWKEFKTAPGVSVTTGAKEGVVLQFRAEALEKMKPGGVLQFINQYR